MVCSAGSLTSEVFLTIVAALVDDVLYASVPSSNHIQIIGKALHPAKVPQIFCKVLHNFCKVLLWKM